MLQGFSEKGSKKCYDSIWKMMIDARTVGKKSAAAPPKKLTFKQQEKELNEKYGKAPEKVDMEQVWK